MEELLVTCMTLGLIHLPLQTKDLTAKKKNNNNNNNNITPKTNANYHNGTI